MSSEHALPSHGCVRRTLPLELQDRLNRVAAVVPRLGRDGSSPRPATFSISAERRWSGSGDFQYGQWRCQPVGTCPWDLQGESSSQRRGPADDALSRRHLTRRFGRKRLCQYRLVPRTEGPLSERPFVCSGTCPSRTCGVLAPTCRERTTPLGRRPSELLVERDEREAEGVDRVRVRDDVVAGREHLQLVARHRWLREELEHGRLRAHQPERQVDAGPTGPLRLLQARPELVPGDRVRAAELERPVRRLRLLDARRRSTRRRPRPRSAGSAASPARRSASPAPASRSS